LCSMPPPLNGHGIGIRIDFTTGTSNQEDSWRP
jgi:hypothetical protein